MLSTLVLLLTDTVWTHDYDLPGRKSPVTFRLVKQGGESSLILSQGSAVLCSTPLQRAFAILGNKSKRNRAQHPYLFLKTDSLCFFIDTHPGVGNAGYLEMYRIQQGGKQITFVRDFMNGDAAEFKKRNVVREYSYFKYMSTVPRWPEGPRFYVYDWKWDEGTGRFTKIKTAKRWDWPYQVWAG